MNRKIRILYLTMSTIPSVKANTIQTINFCNALSSMGVDVFLLVRSKLGELSPSKLKKKILEFYGTGRNIRVVPVYIPVINSKNKRIEEISYLISYFIYSFIACLLSNILRITSRKRLYTFIRTPPLQVAYYLFTPFHRSQIIYEMHNIYRRKTRSIFLRLFIASLNRTKLVITIIDFLRNIIERHIKISRTITLHNAYDPFILRCSDDERNLRKELGLPLNKWIVAYVGQLWIWKNPEFLIDAFSLIKEDDVILLFVGGTPEDIKRVSVYAQKKNVKNIIFKGFVKPSLVPKYLKAVDCLVHYTPSTGNLKSYSPLKIPEYIAAGKPILAPKQPWIEEMLHNGVNALFFNENSPKDLADKIVLLKNNKDLAKRIAENAKQQSEEYTYEKRAKRFLEAILMESKKH